MSNITIQSVVRAFNILDYISKNNGAGVSEISRALGLNKSTTFGLIKTLEAEGYLIKDSENDNYKISIKLYSLAKNALNFDIQSYSKPFLENLSKKYGETIHLVIASENEGIYIDKIESTKSIRIHTEIGDKLQLHCTGVGKAILAYRSKEEIESYINNIGLERYTRNTITNSEDLYAELKRISENGYSIDDAENKEDLYCIAVPILNENREPVYAISISMPIYRSTKEIKDKMVKDLLIIKNKIEIYLKK